MAGVIGGGKPLGLATSQEAGTSDGLPMVLRLKHRSATARQLRRTARPVHLQKVRMPNQVVAAIKTTRLVAAATMKQRSTISTGRSLHAHGEAVIDSGLVCVK